jgi:hypothetical protein
MGLSEKDIARIMENTLTLDEKTRRDTIIDYIGKHQGCTAEDIVNGSKLSGRIKTFRLIKDLKKENVILTDISQNNRRNKKLLFHFQRK